MVDCFVFDIEGPIPNDLSLPMFDVLVFSHVLEHLREPAKVLSKFLKYLVEDGEVLIAVPNILSWRQRLQFLVGRFDYQASGPLDDTHLRFFTYLTADRYLLAESSLDLLTKTVSGSVPLWVLRRWVLPSRWTGKIDRWACHKWPNLFGTQVLLKARKRSNPQFLGSDPSQ